MIVSRTAIDADNNETGGPALTLRGLEAKRGWTFTVTRPRTEAGRATVLEASAEGVLTLPEGVWHEGELTRP